MLFIDIQIRAFNQMGYGPLSNPLQIKTLNSAGTSPTDARHDGQDDMTVLVVAAIAGLLLVVLVLFSLCIWRRFVEWLFVGLVVKDIAVDAGGLGFDSVAGQVDTVSPTVRHRCDVS